MAQFSKLEVLTAMEEIGLIPVFYNKDIEIAVEIANACIRGGAKLVEFTNRGDYAYQVFGKLSQHFSESNQDVILGVGSVIDPYTAALYINNGANFIALLRSFVDLGIHHTQFNVIDRETLLDAQAHPVKYSDLVVRTAGLAAYFVDMTKAVQDQIIERTELTIG